MGMVVVACLAARAAGVPEGHDDINLERHQFGRQSGEAVVLPLGISIFDYEVATLDVTEVAQPLAEGLLEVRGTIGRQVAYSRDLGRLLRLGGERRGQEHRTRASEERATVYQWIPLLS